MELRPLVRAEMAFENGAYGQRLLPWEALNAPFEGAWVTVPAHGATGAHAHHEHEVFIAVSGEAVVEVGDECRPFRAGDVEYHTPGTAHRIVNDGADDFEMYAIWWDPEMSARFVERHRATR
jgi:mannose-6-phosphate isomerase-like protein (cupin superfamily)